MSETTSIELKHNALSEDDLREKYLKLEPQVLKSFNPNNSVEAKTQFLDNTDLTRPNNQYDQLSDPISFADLNAQIDDFIHNIDCGSFDINQKLADVYVDSLEKQKKKNCFLNMAARYNELPSGTEKDEVAKNYMELNIDIYGEPDESTYRSILQEKVKKINFDKLSDKAKLIYDQLIESVNVDLSKSYDKFMPKASTIERMHENVELLYGNLLRHIPDQDKFSPVEMANIFDEIIREEFHGAADGWTVELDEKRKAVTVKSDEKKIFVPANRAEVTKAKMRGLVVHEIGTHMMRSIMGEQSGVAMLQLGMDGYTDTEEGVAKLLEQSANGKYEESGVDHYITIGAAYFDNMNFRQAFEMKWRLNLLSKLKDGVVDESLINKAKDTAYGQVMRIYRGTDELPFFKDLAYYNGSMDVWKYVEQNIDDNPWFIDRMLLDGKMNLFDTDHERVVYEAKVGGYSK